VNDVIVDLTGYDREELIGNSVALLLDEDDYRHIERGIVEQLATDAGQMQTFELTVETADGTLIPCELRVNLLVEDGEFRGTVGVARDISAEEHGQELLRKQRQYDAIFNDPNILVGRLDPDGTVRDINETAMEYIDADLADVVGEPFWETPWWGRGNSVEADVREWVERAAAGEYVDFEADIASLSGEARTVSGYFRPVTDDDGEVVSLIVSDRDVTERQARERELREVERRFQTLVDNYPAGGVSLVDESLRYVMFVGTPGGNAGLTRDDLEGERISDALPEAVADVVVPYYEAALDGESTEVVEAIGDRAYQLHFVPIRDDDGGVTSVMGMSQDITEQTERERDLREAKAQLEAATEAGAVGTWEWHVPEDRFVAGASFARKFGVDPDAAREGVPIDRFVAAIHEDDRERVERKIDAALESCGEYEAEYRVQNADGEWRWVVARGQVECDEDGDPVTFPGAVTDITERKRAELERQRTKQELETIFEILPVGVMVARADGHLERVNEVATEIWGGEVYPAEDQSDYDEYPGWWADTGERVVGPDEWTMARALEGEAVDDPDVFEIESFDGERRTIEVRGKPITDADGEVTRAVVAFTDATERRETQRKLEESNERLEQFAYAASHDLQEPLRMVSSYLQLLESRYSDELDEDAEEFIEFAVDGAERMREMIEGLLEYSRVETQGDPFEPVDLEDVLADVREDLRVKIEESDAAIHSDSLPACSATRVSSGRCSRTCWRTPSSTAATGRRGSTYPPSALATGGDSRSATRASASTPPNGSASSRCSSASTARTNTRGRAWGSPSASASSNATAATSGSTRNREKGRRSRSRCRQPTTDRRRGARKYTSVARVGPLQRLADRLRPTEEREVVAVLQREVRVRHLVVAVAADERDDAAVREFGVDLLDGAADEVLRGHFDLLDVARAPDLGHPVGERGALDDVVDAPRGRQRRGDRPDAEVLEGVDVVRVVRASDDGLDVELRLGQLGDQQVGVVVTRRGDDDAGAVRPRRPEFVGVRPVAVVDGEPLVPRSFDHRYVPFDDDDVLTAVFEALSERTTDGAAADDDDTHWYDVECFRDVSCETALEDDRQQDGEEDDADEEARRCLHADVLEFHGEQRRDRRRDDATRTDRAHERPLRPRVPAAVRGEVDGDGADDCRDDDDRREPRETELRQVVEGQQRRQRDEHEREDDERHVALERLDLLLVGEVSVAEHHPRRRHRRDARFAAERVGGTVGDQRAREYDETGALGCVPRERSTWRSRYQMTAATTRPTRTPTPSRVMKSWSTAIAGRSGLTTTWNTTMARMAAVTSLTTPSVSRAAPTRSRTGTTSRMGVMTVGPVATSRLPTRKETSQRASSR